MTLFFDWLLSNALTASFLALLAFGVSKAWPRRPALAHACWLLVLVKLLTPPLYVFPLGPPAAAVLQAKIEEPQKSEPAIVLNQTSPIPSNASPQPEEADIWELLDQQETTTASKEKVEQTLPATVPSTLETPDVQPAPAAGAEPKVDWTRRFAELWALWGYDILFCLQIVAISGSSLLVILTLARILRFERLLRLAQPAPPALRDMTVQIGGVLQLQRVPSVLIVPGKVGPLLWQRWNEPVIVLPEGLLENIDNKELQTVLAHELTHYRRGDHLWRYLELAAVTFYWWLPSAWWASRRLRQAEEECCDAGVVASLPDGVASYATALVRSLTFVAEPNSYCPALSSGLGPVTLLKRRLKMLHSKVERRLGVRGWLLLMAVAAVALPIGISWADDDTPTPTRRENARRAEDTRQEDARSASTRGSAGRDVLPPASAADDDSALPPRAAAAPRAPHSVSGAAAALPAHSPYDGAAPMAPVPATPASPFGQGRGAMNMQAGGGGMMQPPGDDMRSTLEMAVRQAELDLKARRIKVRQAESAIKLSEMELSKARKLVDRGAAESSEVTQSQAKLENARAELELAQVEVERGELTVEQVKRRLGSMPRSGQQPAVGINPPMNTTPVPPGFSSGGGGGGSFGVAGGRGAGIPGGPGSFGGSGAPPGASAGGPPFGGGMPGFSGGGLSGAGPVGGPGGGPAGLGTAGGRTTPGLAGGLSSDAFFRNFDRANTGKIRRDDVPEWMRDRFFELIDTNHDGVVDREEFSANYNRLWENTTSRPGRGGVGVVRGRGEGSGRVDSTGRVEGGRGESGGRGEAAAPATTRRGEADPRDERIQQLEKELRDMRKALEDLRKREPGAVR